jgi:hypothetical protein
MKSILPLALSFLLPLAAATVSADQQTLDIQLFINGDVGCDADPDQPAKTVTVSLAELNLPIGPFIINKQSGEAQTFTSARIVNVNSLLFGQNLVVGICEGSYDFTGPNGGPVCNLGGGHVLRLTDQDPDNCAESQQIQSLVFQLCPFDGGDCDSSVVNT